MMGVYTRPYLGLLLLVPLARGDWVNRTAVTVSTIERATVYDVKIEDGRTRRVLVIPTHPSEHAAAQELLHRSCQMWIPTHSIVKTVNAYSCVFNSTLIGSLVDDFVGAHSALLKGAHSIHRCQKRTTQYANQPQRVYVTALNTHIAPDVWHADGCDRETRPGQAYFTVLHYPHAREWEEEWGGHVEFAPGECDGYYDGNTETKAPAVLRLHPSPHRAVVFSGPLVHRATRPSKEAAGRVEGAPPTWLEEHGGSTPAAQDVAWRYSLVRQLECAIQPGIAADGTPLEADAETAGWLSSWGGGAGIGVALLLCLCAMGMCALTKAASARDGRTAPASTGGSISRKEEAVDCGDILCSRCCRGCALFALWACACPVFVARCMWQAVLPDMRWEPLAGLAAIVGGVGLEPGDDWPFECAKLHCPAQSLSCLLDGDCRQLVLRLATTDPCPGGHAATRDAVCGTECSSAARAFLACLGSDGRRCVYASGGKPAVVRRKALSEAEMATLAALSRDAAARHGSTHRAFGVADGTTGHNVTFLQPLIYEHAALLQRLRGLVHGAALEAEWELDDVSGLSLRCAEHLA